MKILIITVAGTASRFNSSLAVKIPKCIYTPDIPQNTLLYHLCEMASDYEKLVIVGGYLFDVLKETLRRDFTAFEKKLVLVENKEFERKGSMYSLYLGLCEAESLHPDEIAFVEGDLYCEEDFFNTLTRSAWDTVTVNTEPINAVKSVVFYVDAKGLIHYVFDTSHQLLEIKEPFQAVFNSAQMWKFIDVPRLTALNSALTEEEKAGMNLVLVQKYFETSPFGGLSILTAREWVNCNSLSDYEVIYRKLKESRDETNQ